MTFKEQYFEFQRAQYTPYNGDSHLSGPLKACNYELISKKGGDPRVVLLGMIHPDGKVKRHDDLLRILQTTLRPGDVVALEGANGQMTKTNVPRGTFGFDVMHTIPESCAAVHNEDDRLIARAYIAHQRLKNFPSEEAYEGFFNNTRLRDEAMCNQPPFGLVHLVNGLPVGGKVVQIVGMIHIGTKTIENLLAQQNIPHEVYVPAEYIKDS